MTTAFAFLFYLCHSSTHIDAIHCNNQCVHFYLPYHSKLDNLENLFLRSRGRWVEEAVVVVI